MASDTSLTLTRRQLYDAVWSEPLAKAAAKLSLSEAALNRTCLAKASEWPANIKATAAED